MSRDDRLATQDAEGQDTLSRSDLILKPLFAVWFYLGNPLEMAGFVAVALFSFVLVFPLLSIGAQATSAGTPSFPSNGQLRQFRTMGDPRLAPDGKRILIRVTDTTADGGKSHLWLTGVSGEEPRQLTYSPEAEKRGEFDGQWMPDGQGTLFLAKRDAHVSLYRLPMTGGEAKTFSLKITPVVDQAKLPDGSITDLDGRIL